MHHIDAHGARQMDRYLLQDEQLVAVVHQHWARMLETAVSVIGGFVLVVMIGLVTPASWGAVSNAAWWLWFALLVYGVARYWQWRREWFCATDRRLLLTYGIVTHKVAMMPMHKVTDMSFNRSIGGRLLGYGSFVMESAGQDQAMHRIDFIPHPDQTYRAICHQIFGARDEADDLPLDQEWQESPGEAPDPTEVPVRPLGGYLPDQQPRHSMLGHRVLRRPRDADRSAERSAEQEQGWLVSNEDASTPQTVDHRSPRRGRT